MIAPRDGFVVRSGDTSFRAVTTGFLIKNPFHVKAKHMPIPKGPQTFIRSASFATA